MAAEQRKLLEQLMGQGATSRSTQISLNDPKVCRSYIAGTCPHDLFTNTKQDLGPCSKVHSEPLKNEYEALPEHERKKYGFEYDYIRDLQKYIDECNRRIDTAQRRLEKTPDEIRQTNVLLKSISDLTSTINNGLLEVEILGELSEVSRACDEFFKVRQAAQAKQERERELKELSDTSGPSGHQKLQVCDVCGAYLSRLDNDRRLADHFYGKMHLGYAQMRKAYDAFPKEMRGGRGRPAGPVGGPDDDGRGGGYGDGGWGRGPGARGPGVVAVAAAVAVTEAAAAGEGTGAVGEECLGWVGAVGLWAVDCVVMVASGGVYGVQGTLNGQTMGFTRVTFGSWLISDHGQYYEALQT